MRSKGVKSNRVRCLYIYNVPPQKSEHPKYSLLTVDYDNTGRLPEKKTYANIAALFGNSLWLLFFHLYDS